MNGYAIAFLVIVGLIVYYAVKKGGDHGATLVAQRDDSIAYAERIKREGSPSELAHLGQNELMALIHEEVRQLSQKAKSAQEIQALFVFGGVTIGFILSMAFLFSQTNESRSGVHPAAAQLNLVCLALFVAPILLGVRLGQKKGLSAFAGAKADILKRSLDFKTIVEISRIKVPKALLA